MFSESISRILLVTICGNGSGCPDCMSKIRLENVSKHFPDGTVAVNRVSLEVNNREFLVLVGPSGCGKSTTLRLIAGLETVTDGRILMGDCVVNDVAPKDRDIAMVFQNYALYPHMSVYNNLSFGLRLRFGGGYFARVLRRLFKPDRATELSKLRRGIDQQVRQTALRLGIDKLLDRKPHQLSGGERQRVALGRAIVRNPAAFLLDEPLSNLDETLRSELRAEIRRLHREIGATMIYVTHDQTEAMTLGDRIAVMNGGEIRQIGSPELLFRRPADLFVARFIGSVPINLCSGAMVHRDGTNRFESDRVRFEIGDEVFEAHQLDLRDLRVIIGFRADDLEIESNAETSCDFTGEVFAVERLGNAVNLHLTIAGKSKHEQWNIDTQTKMTNSIVVKTTADTRLSTGDHVRLNIRKDRVLWFDADSGKNLLKD